MVRSATLIRGTGGAVPGAVGLEVEDIQDHGEVAVDDDDENDGGDHGRSGREPHGGRAPPGLHTTKAPDERDQDPEHGALADADEEARQADGPPGLLKILDGTEAEHPHPDDRASQDPDEIRID